MITSNYQVDGDIYSYADKFFCDSSDDKPSNADAKDGLINGAILEETDTGKTYIFDKKANKWTEKSAGGGGGGGSTTLAGLTDVDISNPTDGQTLVYNSTSGKWENGAGGGVLVLRVDNVTGQADKTVREIMAAAANNVVFFASDERQEANEICYYQLQYVADHEEGKSYNYVLHFRSANLEVDLNANNLDDYPVWHFLP